MRRFTQLLSVPSLIFALALSLSACESDFPSTVDTNMPPISKPGSDQGNVKSIDISYYIDAAKVNDANDGTKGKPFRTIQKARDTIRNAKKKGVAVCLMGGIYYQTETLTFNRMDSGNPAAPNIYMACPGEKPILKGSKAITNFVPFSGGIVKSDLKAQGLESPSFSQVFMNSQRMVLARYPNYDSNNSVEGGFLYAADDTPNSGLVFTYKAGEINPAKWKTNPKDIQVFLFPNMNYDAFTFFIDSIDQGSRKVSLGDYAMLAWEKVTYKGLGGGYVMTKGDRFYFQNIFEELDSASEWYLDKPSGTLYFYPPKGITASDSISVPIVDDVILFKNAKDIKLDGIAIEEAEGNGISINRSENISITSCAIKNCKENGVYIFNGEKIMIDGCEISNVGGAGIIGRNSERYRKGLRASNYVIVNNTVHDTGNFYKAASIKSGISMLTTGATISQNHIYNEPRWGIYGEGANNTIEYNYIHDVNLETRDTGAIYIWTKYWTNRGNKILHNYIENSVGYCKELDGSWRRYCAANGIYLDDMMSGNTVKDNTVIKASLGGVMLHGGRDNVFEGNTFVEIGTEFETTAQFWLNQDITPSALEQFWNNLQAVEKENIEYTSSGKVGGAFILDGENDTIEVLDDDSLDLENELSIALWFRPTADVPATGSVLVGKYFTEYELSLAPKGCVLTYSFNGKYNQDGTPGTEEGISACNVEKQWKKDQWYHLVWTMKGTSEKLYLNGVLMKPIDGKAKKSPGVKGFGHNLFIGARDRVEKMFFKGAVDEVYLFNREIDFNKVLEIYQNKFNPNNNETLVGLWTFDNKTADDFSIYGNDGDYGYDKAKIYESFPELKTISQAMPPDKVMANNTIKGNVFIYPETKAFLYHARNVDFTTTKMNDNIFWHGWRTPVVTNYYEYAIETGAKMETWVRKTWAEWKLLGGPDFEKNSFDVADVYKTNPFKITSSGNNILANGTFDQGISQWFNWPDTEKGKKLISSAWEPDCAPLGLNGGCLKISTVETNLKYPLVVLHTELPIVKDKTYEVGFSVVSNQPDALSIVVTDPTWLRVSLYEVIPMDKTRKDFVAVFTAKETEKVQLQFGTEEADTYYYIDNVFVKEISADLNDPKDDYVILGNTEAANKTFSLEGNSYCDLNNNVISGSIELAPRQSKVLLNCFCNHDYECNNRESHSTCPDDCK